MNLNPQPCLESIGRKETWMPDRSILRIALALRTLTTPPTTKR